MDPMLILVAGLAFIAIGAVGAVLVGANSGSGKAAKRVQAVAQRGRGNPRQAGTRGGSADPSAQRRKQLEKTLLEQERKRRASIFDASARLRQAGVNLEAKTFLMICAGVGLAVALLAMLFHLKPLVALMVGFIAGGGIPMWLLGVMANKRRTKFTLAFTDAVDIIVRGLRSGLPLHDCLKVIGKECPEPLASEFRRLVENLAMGVTMEQGLEKMHDRTPAPELRFFAIVLNIQQKTGGNLGEALGNLSTVLRSRRMLKEKIKALSGEAVASAAVIGCMPPGVAALLSVVNPHYLQVMFTDPRGHMMLASGAGVMFVGTMVMRKMINFKF
jgi:tight adherence protein B